MTATNTHFDEFLHARIGNQLRKYEPEITEEEIRATINSVETGNARKRIWQAWWDAQSQLIRLGSPLADRRRKADRSRMRLEAGVFTKGPCKGQPPDERRRCTTEADYRLRLQRLAIVEDEMAIVRQEYEAREAELTRFDEECRRGKMPQP